MTETYPAPSPPLQSVEPHQPAFEHELNSVGMWIFLAGEVLFFGALFTAYVVYRNMYPDVFAEASRHLDVVLGSINTFILLTSSLTMALAVNAIQSGKHKTMVLFLVATMILGSAFVVIKGSEYLHVIAENLFPGENFVYHGQQPQQAALFFSLYFIMTGLHAAHMLIGILVLFILAVLGWRRSFTPEHYAPVELAGLFWHFVDIVWIFLFPLLYLIDRT
jgi:cytochrome c oxidase subunit III